MAACSDPADCGRHSHPTDCMMSSHTMEVMVRCHTVSCNMHSHSMDCMYDIQTMELTVRSAASGCDISSRSIDCTTGSRTRKKMTRIHSVGRGIAGHSMDCMISSRNIERVQTRSIQRDHRVSIRNYEAFRHRKDIGHFVHSKCRGNKSRSYIETKESQFKITRHRATEKSLDFLSIQNVEGMNPDHTERP